MRRPTPEEAQLGLDPSKMNLQAFRKAMAEIKAKASLKSNAENMIDPEFLHIAKLAEEQSKILGGGFTQKEQAIGELMSEEREKNKIELLRRAYGIDPENINWNQTLGSGDE